MSKLNYREGANHAYENSHAILKMAELAFIEEQFGISGSLTILSGEEAVKALMCAIEYYYPEHGIPGFQDVFRKHRFKHQMIIACLEFMESYIKESQEKMIKVKEAFNILGFDHVDKKLLDQYKLLAEGLDAIVKVFDHKFKFEIIDWWENADVQKNNGLYVGKTDQAWLIPKNTSATIHIQGARYVQTLLSQVAFFIGLMDYFTYTALFVITLPSSNKDEII